MPAGLMGCGGFVAEAQAVVCGGECYAEIGHKRELVQMIDRRRPDGHDHPHNCSPRTNRGERAWLNSSIEIVPFDDDLQQLVVRALDDLLQLLVKSADLGVLPTSDEAGGPTPKDLPRYIKVSRTVQLG
jgi:hypothetical protein